MNIYISKTHADEDGPFVEEGKLGIICASKENLLGLCDFFDKIRNHLEDNDNCHMHFQDHLANWNKDTHVDIEINLVNE